MNHQNIMLFRELLCTAAVREDAELTKLLLDLIKVELNKETTNG